MRINFAVERLLVGELADRFGFKTQPYGRTVFFSAFGYRVIVDLITRPAMVG